MKKIIGVALLFLAAMAPALAGGNGSGGGGGGMSSPGGGSSDRGGGFGMGGGISHGSGGFGSGGFGSQSQRSFAPPERIAPTREVPMRFAMDPDGKRIKPRWVQSEYVNTQMRCPKNPYQQPRDAMNGCQVNPWVLYAFPGSDF